MPRDAIFSKTPATPLGPFSPAVRSGDFIFLSGHVGEDVATGKLVSDDVTAQAEQIFVNIRSVLAAAGKTFADVIRVGVYLTDVNDFARLNAVYTRHFDKPYPARTTIGVAALPLGARIEIDLVAR